MQVSENKEYKNGESVHLTHGSDSTSEDTNGGFSFCLYVRGSMLRPESST